MAFRFRPVDSTFYDLFAEAAGHLVVGAGLLAEMLADGTDREAVAKRMREAEHAADETTHAIVRRVNSTFITPFDREDIYRLASTLDDVMDHYRSGRQSGLSLRADQASGATRQER